MKTTTITLDAIHNVLAQVVDPEIGCNVIDLGLIYDIAITGAKVTIAMTLTTPGCPMHETIAEGVRSALLALDGVEEVAIHIVWDPPWNPQMMSKIGRQHVGLAD